MIKKILKKKVLTPVEQPIVIEYVPAMQMEEGVKYVNIMGTVILELEGIQPYEGVEKGMRAIMGTKVHYKGVSDLGDVLHGTMPGNAAVMANMPDLEKDIMHSFNVYKGKCADNLKVKASARPPKLDENGEVVVRKSRGEVDPVSGCSAGSQGHVLGMIMIKNKCSITNRGICIAEMTACLEKDYGLDNKKAKALASSWYSTNWIRKPSFYQKKW